MNKTIFMNRLITARKAKYKTQQAFADAYKEKYGMIRKTKEENDDGDMFGTIQSWEQGKTYPTADVLSNICDLLDVDSDYLMGRINQRKHDIKEICDITMLSEDAVEKILNNKTTVPNPQLTEDELLQQEQLVKEYRSQGIKIVGVEYPKEITYTDTRNVEFLNALIESEMFETLYTQFEAYRQFVFDKSIAVGSFRGYSDIYKQLDKETSTNERESIFKEMDSSELDIKLNTYYIYECASSMDNTFKEWLKSVDINNK